MIKIDPVLPEFTGRLLAALQALLASAGIDLDRVDAFTGARNSRAPYRFDFPSDASMSSTPCLVCFPAKGGEHVLETDFSSGRILLATLLTLEQKPHTSDFGPDESVRTILERFDIDSEDVVWATVPDEPETTFLAPSGEWFVYGYRDIYPPAEIISRSRHRAAPAIHLVMDERARKADLHARLGSFLR